MKVIEKGIMPDGTEVQIEDWNENYSSIPYGSTIASYPISKMSHKGHFSPKGNEKYRFAFDFKSFEETREAFCNLVSGNKVLTEFKRNLTIKEYADCI